MERDIRASALYQEVEAFVNSVRQPGTGQISDAAELNVSRDGREVVFAGTILDRLEGKPPTRICLTEASTGDTQVLTFGPNTDRLPKFSPDGRSVAFLSDRQNAGDFQLYLLDPHSRAAKPTSRVQGWVEYLHWSPDGRRILLGVAGHGADVSGGQGAVTSQQTVRTLPSWMPIIETGDENYRWRSAWVYEIGTGEARQVSTPGTNVWESAWCGPSALAAVTSPGPAEGTWYSARMVIIDIETGTAREIYRPQDQLGWPAGSPSGRHLAFVEAVCSDRWIVAGELRVIDVETGKIRHVDTHAVDITHTEWRSDRHLLVAGHREFESVVGILDAPSCIFTEIWASRDLTTGGRYINVSGFGDAGDCALVGESFQRAPELAIIRQGAYRAFRSFDLSSGAHAHVIEAIEQVRWQAQDGLEIQGWLLRPKAKEPVATILVVHGGPVSQIRPSWYGRAGLVFILVKRGYAVFLPNPRGSSGRGSLFARQVYGDMGGADAQDLLSGLDALVERGVADPSRIGVTGGSYGGFMTSWLITQDPRFAAAVAVAPHTNQVTCRLVGNLPQFMDLITKDHYDNPGGHYFERSPIMHAKRVKTPTLNICGALDRCTPPEEAVQFHNALVENGVMSELAIYPEEGHGIRKYPAAIDYIARIAAWFETYMPSGSRS